MLGRPYSVLPTVAETDRGSVVTRRFESTYNFPSIFLVMVAHTSSTHRPVALHELFRVILTEDRRRGGGKSGGIILGSSHACPTPRSIGLASTATRAHPRARVAYRFLVSWNDHAFVSGHEPTCVLPMTSSDSRGTPTVGGLHLCVGYGVSVRGPDLMHVCVYLLQ